MQGLESREGGPEELDSCPRIPTRQGCPSLQPPREQGQGEETGVSGVGTGRFDDACGIVPGALIGDHVAPGLEEISDPVLLERQRRPVQLGPGLEVLTAPGQQERSPHGPAGLRPFLGLLQPPEDLDVPVRGNPVFPHLVEEGRCRDVVGGEARRGLAPIPEQLGGQFDFVFCGSVLIHVRDQLLALERIAGLVKPSGLFISAEEYEPRMDLLPWAASRYMADRDKDIVFWLPSRKTWGRMLGTAGFDKVRQVGHFKLRAVEGWNVPHVVHHARK